MKPTPLSTPIEKSPVNRRQFLATASVATLGFPAILRGATDDKPLRTAVIGCGWFGMVDLKAARRAGNVVCEAICDVDTAHLDKFSKETEELQGKAPRAFKDYQELLDQVELDFVIIATPPQWHALPFIAACQKGLDIYCEKPLAYDVREGQAMVKAAREAGVTVQVGFQRRQSPAVMEAMNYIRDGKAGNIVQVDAQIHYNAPMESTEVQAPPATLDWDHWCGPSPLLPYTPNIGHIKWRLEKETGHGHLVDWGIHWIDSIRMTLGETTPNRIQATGGIVHLQGQITTPDTLSATFDFGTCPVHWRHRLWGAAEANPETANSAIYYGDKETVIVVGNQWITLTRGKDPVRTVHEPERTDAGARHLADFFEACRTGGPVNCSVEEGFQSAATVQLGMIAYDTGDTIHWDHAAGEIRNNPEAARLLKRDYRAPYSHPG